MNYDVFISYSRKDSEVAGRIYDALTAAGITCFIDREGISGGADFPTVLSEAIMGAKVLLLVASENSYASEFTQKELTFAVSNKGSRFIFPLIVDDSQLPKNLEFLLSNINWRTLSGHYRIEKEMVRDIQAKLADPHAGETIRQQEKNTVKTMMIAIISVLVIGIGIVVGLTVRQSQKAKAEKEAAALAEAQAKDARHSCIKGMEQADILLQRADSLRDHRASMLSSFPEEKACLDEASAVLYQVDSIRNSYISNTTFAYLFTTVNTAPVHQQLMEKLDSMFTVWKGYALSNYEDYRSLPDDISRSISLRYVDIALQLHPYDEQLLKIKDTLTQ